MVDGATSEWIPIVSGVPQRSVLYWVLFCSSFIPASELFEHVENMLYAHADNSTSVAVVRKPADRPAVASSLNRDLASIQELCNHWCGILNPYKTKTLVVSRSRTMNPPHGDLVLSAVSICADPNLGILGVKSESRLTLPRRKCSCYCLPCLSKNRYFEVGNTSVLLRCHYALVLLILEYCSVWGSDAEYHLQLLERQVYSVARLCPDQTLLSLCL